MNHIKNILVESLENQENCDLYYDETELKEIKAFKGSIANFVSSAEKFTNSRVIVDKKLGASFTEKLTKEEIKGLLKQSRINTQFVDPDEGNVLHDKEEKKSYSSTSQKLENLPLEKIKESLLAAEQTALSFDKKIVNVPYCTYLAKKEACTIANSFGLLKSQNYEFCYSYLGVMAKNGEETQTGLYFDIAESPKDLDFETIAKKASEIALLKLGAEEIASGEYPIVFSRDPASQLLGAFLANGSSPLFGENIQKNRSIFAEKLGKKIGSELFTIIDDPQKSIVKIHFDGDGVSTGKVTFIDKGIFTTVAHNCYSAAREKGAHSTGHGLRTPFGLSTGLHHAYLTPGQGNLDALLNEMNKGLLITEIEGLHAGLNPITGDFSLSAQGFWINQGKKEYPVRNLVVAGNFFDLSNKLIDKADDARENGFEGIRSPAIFIETLSVSGK